MDVRIFKVEVNYGGEISRYYIKYSLEDNENFLEFKKKIFERVPALVDKQFKIMWIDDDGDEIYIITSEDFAFCLEMNVKKIYVRCNVPPAPDNRKRCLPQTRATPKRSRFSDSNSDVHLIDSDSSSLSSSVHSVQLDSEEELEVPKTHENSHPGNSIEDPANQPSTSAQSSNSQLFTSTFSRIHDLVGQTFRRHRILSDPSSADPKIQMGKK